MTQRPFSRRTAPYDTTAKHDCQAVDIRITFLYNWRLMANRRSSIKKIRVDKKRVQNNLRVKTELKTVIRRVNEFIQQKNVAELKTGGPQLFSKLDKAVKKGIIHENRASRVKSRIALKINSLAAAK